MARGDGGGAGAGTEFSSGRSALRVASVAALGGLPAASNATHGAATLWDPQTRVVALLDSGTSLLTFPRPVFESQPTPSHEQYDVLPSISHFAVEPDFVDQKR